jgi:hypothetical protein
MLSAAKISRTNFRVTSVLTTENVSWLKLTTARINAAQWRNAFKIIQSA